MAYLLILWLSFFCLSLARAWTSASVNRMGSGFIWRSGKLDKLSDCPSFSPSPNELASNDNISSRKSSAWNFSRKLISFSYSWFILIIDCRYIVGDHFYEIANMSLGVNKVTKTIKMKNNYLRDFITLVVYTYNLKIFYQTKVLRKSGKFLKYILWWKFSQK